MFRADWSWSSQEKRLVSQSVEISTGQLYWHVMSKCRDILATQTGENADRYEQLRSQVCFAVSNVKSRTGSELQDRNQ